MPLPPAGPSSTSVGSMRTFAVVLACSFALAGCNPPLSNLLLPMEPTREAIAAPRRQLTAAEKDSVSQAVTLKMGASDHREFQWPPLVVRAHGHATDYCGQVSRDDPGNGQVVFRQYYAKLSFDRRGTLLKVDVLSIDDLNSNGIPTTIDSICRQDGYMP
jgi:hypothetical protein